MAGVVRAQGLSIDLPPGWEAQVYRRPAAVGPTTNAVMHAANFPLPPERGDFGGGVVETMSVDDALLVLIEYDRESARTALFAQSGPPPSLSPQSFSPDTLQRTIVGQAGAQVFFHVEDRAFCLYVVLGAFRNLIRLLPMVNAVLGTMRIDPRG